MPTLARSVQWLHVEYIDALHLSQDFQSLETGGLVQVGGNGTGLTTGRQQIVHALDFCESSPSALLPSSHAVLPQDISQLHSPSRDCSWLDFSPTLGSLLEAARMLVECCVGRHGVARGSHWERTSARSERERTGSGRADDGALGKRWGGAAEEHGGGGGGVLQCSCSDCESESFGNVVGLIR